MAMVGRQFAHLQELLDYLNDIVVGRPLEPLILGLDGLTLIINDGEDKPVTFSDPTGAGLTPNVVVVQINAVKPGAASLRNYGHESPPQSRLAFVSATLTVKTSGTANALLGLPTTGSDLVVGAEAIPHTGIALLSEFANHFTVIHETE